MLQQVQLYTSPSQWHLQGVQADSYPWIHTLQCGGAVWDSTAHVPSAQWWEHLACGPWEQPCSLSPVRSAAQEPSSKGKTFNFGHTARTESLRWAGVTGALWQGQGMGQLGLLCSHIKRRSISPLFSILKHRRTCTCLRSDSVCQMYLT